MNEKVRRILNRIKEHLKKRYGDEIIKVILYGSHARGKATEDSDIDVLVVIDDKLDPKDVENYLNDLLFEILLNEGELVSIVAVKESIFKNYRLPFFISIKDEGISV